MREDGGIVTSATGSGSWQGVSTTATLWCRRVVVVMLLASIVTTSSAHPVRYTVASYDQECWYDQLEEDEYLTVSLFLTDSGGTYGVPAATAVLEGPLTEERDVTAASHLGDALLHYDKLKHGFDFQVLGRSTRNYDDVDAHGLLDFRTVVQFGGEAASRNHASYDDDDDDDDDDDRQRRRHRGRRSDDDDFMERQEMKYRHKLERRNQRMQRARDMKQTVATHDTTEPWVKTVKVYAAGWYRACVQASSGEITAEFEMRKSSELGIPQTPGGHVPSLDAMFDTYEDFEHYEADQDEDAAEAHDLEEAGTAVNALFTLLSDLKEKQSEEMHGMQMHRATDARSHRRMKTGSLVETFLFVCVTGFQVHIVRKWFAGGPLLGR